MSGKSSSIRGQKLFYYLQRLSAPELKQFRFFLESPLLGNSLQGVAILDVLSTRLEKGVLTTLQPEWFAEIMIPDAPMDARKVHYTWVRLSVFQEKLMEFLAFQEYRADPTAHNRYVLQRCKNQGWDKYLDSIYKKGMRELPKAVGADQIHAQLELEIIINEHLSDQGVKPEAAHLTEVMDALDQYYLVEKLKYACATENAHLIWGEGPKPEGMDSIIQSPNQASPIIQAYLHTFQMLHLTRTQQAGSEAHFQQVFIQLKHPQQFARPEAMDLFTYAQNYCILQVRSKQPAYLEKLKQLYDQMLASGIILEQGSLSPVFYKNTVTLMCQLRQFDWAENFIESYKEKLISDPEQLAYTYNLAVLHFHQKEYARVVRLLYHRIHQFEQLTYGIGARIYLCKALWEQEDFEWLLNVLNAFKQYLYRNQELLPADKSRHSKFVRHLKKITLANTGTPGRRLAQLQKLRGKMETAGELTLYPWLRRILQEALG